MALAKPKWTTVSKIEPESTHLNIKMKCVSCKEVEIQGRKEWEAVLGDASGRVTLLLRNEDHASVCKEGASLRMQNAKTIMQKGFVRVVIDKWAVLKPLDEALSFTVGEKDVSAVEYELAA